MNSIVNIFKQPRISTQENPSQIKESSTISKIFDQVQSALTFPDNRLKSSIEKKKSKEFLGGALGAELAILAKSTGATTGLHEVVGHGLLGIKLTTQDANPKYEVDGWRSFDKMTQTNSLQAGLTRFFQWLFLGTGAGTTYHSSSTEPNGIGQAMGPSGQDAWISVAGSLPGLVVDTLAVTGGMQLKKRAPVLGTTLVGFGLTDNMMNAAYPISAAAMSKNQMKSAAANGHDFANFALEMSAITGISAQDIAISTAVFWTVFVPAAAVLSYLHTKSHIKDIVPDAIALKNWIQKAGKDPLIAEKLKKCYDSYPKKKLLDNTPIEKLLSSTIMDDFISYLLETIPSKTLDASKKEILSSWEKNLPKDRVQTALVTTSVVGLGAVITSKILNFLALASSSLTTAATTLSYVAIPLVGVSVVSSGYQLHKDLKCPNSTVPKTAKMLSIAHLITTIACSVLVIAAFFIPGFNLIFLGALLFGCVTTILLSHKRSEIIRKQFALTQAVSAEVWNVMYPLWKRHKIDKRPMGKVLKNWSNRVSKKVNLEAFYKSESEIVCTDDRHFPAYNNAKEGTE